ncbi:MAG: (Fe-S)-binding protein [Rubrimonas sp.]|uniref:(Fe-S)-binding protein n=1 Tax=Rubrimonas sp. TaxID=2036015 RepID=UPI002FDC7FAA
MTAGIDTVMEQPFVPDTQGDDADKLRVEKAMKNFAKDFGRTAATYMEACIHCGACAKACHFYEATHDPKFTPILKLEPFKQAYKREAGPLAFIYKRLGLKPKVTIAELETWQELLYDSCTLCGRCTLICPMSIDIASLVRKARHGMSEAGLVPQDLYDAAKEQADGVGLPGATPDDFVARVRALSAESGVPINVDKVRADVMVCTSQADLTQYPEAIVAMAKILNRMGLDWTYSTRGYETSNYGIVSGNEAWQRAASDRLIGAATALGARTVVLPECGQDYQAMRWEAANVHGAPLPFRVLHAVELLEEGVKSGALKFQQIGDTVTFHDPCQVSRRGGAAEAPRVVMEALGLQLREPHSPEELNWCCGGGGGVQSIRRADPLRYAAFEIKMKQIGATGANMLATTCNSCRAQFDDAGAHFKWDKKMNSLLVLAADNLVAE